MELPLRTRRQQTRCTRFGPRNLRPGVSKHVPVQRRWRATAGMAETDRPTAVTKETQARRSGGQYCLFGRSCGVSSAAQGTARVPYALRGRRETTRRAEIRDYAVLLHGH